MTDNLTSNDLVSRRGRSYRGPYAFRWTDDDYLARIYSRCVVDPSGCILWQGWKNHRGYGEASYRNKTWLLHRLIYTIKVGPIPRGMHVCHRCDVRNCINSDHLWLGTQRQNLLDMVAKGRHNYKDKTHCKYGHPLCGDNVRIYKQTKGNGIKRACRTCGRLRPWESK